MRCLWDVSAAMLRLLFCQTLRPINTTLASYVVRALNWKSCCVFQTVLCFLTFPTWGTNKGLSFYLILCSFRQKRLPPGNSSKQTLLVPSLSYYSGSGSSVCTKMKAETLLVFVNCHIGLHLKCSDEKLIDCDCSMLHSNTYLDHN